MRSKSLKSQRGALSFDAVIGLVVIMAVLAMGASALMPANVAKKVGLASMQTDQIDRGAANWGAEKLTGMTGVTMTLLSGDNYIPTDLGDGVSKNPWGGNITVAVGALQHQYTVGMTSVPADACAQLADKLRRKGAVCNAAAQTVSYTISI